MSKNYFSRIFSYAWVYKKYFILNILSNIFYAFFGTMSMISLFPMLKVLFEQTEALTTPPAWRGGLDIVRFAEDYLNFFVTTKKLEGNNDVLIFMVGLIVITFLLKNIFNYLSMFFITYLRNGVVFDIRNDIYNKILKLSLLFTVKKTKEILWQEFLQMFKNLIIHFYRFFHLLLKNL